MTDWLERIDRTTEGGILAEHLARYRFASPLIADARLWVDLGCGNGIGLRAGLGKGLPGRVLLADLDEAALGSAREAVSGGEVSAVRADLATEEGVAAVAERVAAGGSGPMCITCFETVEHLKNFIPLLLWLVELADGGDATVVLSVPNEAERPVPNPYHVTTWGEGALNELRSLLPAEHLVARQVPLSGSAIAIEFPASAPATVEIAADPVPSHQIVALGARIGELAPVIDVEPDEISARLAWERRREADLAYYRSRLAELEATLGAGDPGDPAGE